MARKHVFALVVIGLLAACRDSVIEPPAYRPGALGEPIPQALQVPPAPGLLPVYHRWCGRVAFYSKFRLSNGEPVQASNFVLLDGSTPSSNTVARCGACGRVVDFNTADDVDGVTYERLEPKALR